MGFSGQNSQRVQERLKSGKHRWRTVGDEMPRLFGNCSVDIGDEIAQPGNVCTSLVGQNCEPLDEIDACAVQEVLELGDGGVSLSVPRA